MGNWERPRWTPGGGDAYVHFVLFGELPEPLRLDAARYRSEGPPEGVEVYVAQRGSDEGNRLLRDLTEDREGVFAVQLDEVLPGYATAVRHASQACIVSGTVSDPSDLTYLRDTVGLVMCLLDAGAHAVLDTQAFRWWSPEGWRQQVFGPDAPVVERHVSIVVSDVEEEGAWYRTRGMRKFGRPDPSLRGVDDDHAEAATDLLRALMQSQALGEVIADGEEIRAPGLPEGMTCHHGGSLDDPHFNNVHLAIHWP